MQPGARLQAAIEVLAEVLERHRPAAQALNDWGRTHRFAGSRDRAVIGNIVFDALRTRGALAYQMGSDAPRALALGVMAHVWGEAPSTIDGMCSGERTPAPLQARERAGLGTALDADAPDWARGSYPQWLDDQFRAAFGSRAAAEGAALAERAPVDLRANTLKADRAKVLRALRAYAPKETPYSPVGVRVAAGARHQKAPQVEADAAHGKGWFEVQDEGSQIAAILAGARPRDQVADVCAGAGGKTLALAAQMQNKGQIHAYDADKTRLRPIFERLKRAGVRNAQMLPAADETALTALRARMDLVFVDAPCSGSGAWRRRPDAKWRLSPQALERRHAEQQAVLSHAAELVRPNGRLIYATCSVLPSENDGQINRFRETCPNFEVLPIAQVWQETLAIRYPGCATGRDDRGPLLLSPHTHGTDGFFIAILRRMA